ncbi:hypothetical protein HGF13_00655 [Rhodobacteraceae bacterium R_SAG5]|nr:hypothetical protein [Rhodobacteraceae bacterium R_SAG5]
MMWYDSLSEFGALFAGIAALFGAAAANIKKTFEWVLVPCFINENNAPVTRRPIQKLQEACA